MSNAPIERQTLLTAQLVFSDAEALVPKIAATVNDEVSRHHEVIAGELGGKADSHEVQVRMGEKTREWWSW